MEFCPDCEGILLPKKGTKNLYCKVCDKVIKVETKDDPVKSYKIDKKIKHKIPTQKMVYSKSSNKSISDEDRRAMEDFYFER
jgi:DNA-directed RNA polymerase subunit M/transcription elongation factor TFIIS